MNFDKAHSKLKIDIDNATKDKPTFEIGYKFLYVAAGFVLVVHAHKGICSTMFQIGSSCVYRFHLAFTMLERTCCFSAHVSHFQSSHEFKAVVSNKNVTLCATLVGTTLQSRSGGWGRRSVLTFSSGSKVAVPVMKTGRERLSL